MKNRQRVIKMLEQFQPVADKHGVTLGQLAIGWTVVQRGCTHALVGARTVHQVLENAGGGSLQLDDGDLEIINSTIDSIGKDIP